MVKRLSARTVGTSLLVSMVLLASPGAAAPPSAPSADQLAQRTQLGWSRTPKSAPSAAILAGKATPRGANPWTSLQTVQQSDANDLAGWRAHARQQSRRDADRLQRQQAPAAAGFERVYREREPVGLRGSNDTFGSAEFLRGIGTGGSDQGQVSILGDLAPSSIDNFASTREDDGALPLANPLPLPDGQSTQAFGVIGNGPHGTRTGDGTGDFDWFRMANLQAGDRITVDLDTPQPFGDLDPTVTAWDADGNAFAFNDDDGESFDSYLGFQVPTAGTYFVSIEGYGSFQIDPFDSGSGIGAGSEGSYNVTFGRNASDVDMFSVALEPGDVVSASVTGGGSSLALYTPDRQLGMGSTQDASFIYPEATQLTGGGNAVLDHVAATAGRYRLAVATGSGGYDATLRILRPGFEQQSGARQTVFLDFDGEELNTGPLGGRGVTELSPLSAFMGRFGLGPQQEAAVIDKVVSTVQENLRGDLRARIDPAVTVRVLNSDDHRDPFGRSNVSRVIVGGTIEESGIPTIGIASSIDPGNYGGEDTALVLLDILSDPRGQFGDPSLKTYLRPRSNRVEFVGQAIGNVVSHEIGHYIGSWHTELFNGVDNVMDPGGDFPSLYGVGPDRVGGTADDIDVDFVADRFSSFEGFTGTEDTAVRSGYGLVRFIRP